VLKRAQLTRVWGHIMDDGHTRNRLRSPPKEKPNNCVDKTGCIKIVSAKSATVLGAK